MTAVTIVLIALCLGAYYLIERQLHPIRRCPSCRGSKRNTTNPERWGICRRCGGKGELPRWGTERRRR
jgi:hypothetical protein